LRRETKQEYIAGLKEQLLDSQFVLRTRFTGLDVSSMTALRANLRNSGTGYKVVKNTLLRLAVEGTQYESLVEDLKGPIALAFSSEDPVATAKVLTEFAKDAECFTLEQAVLDGKALSASDIETLAELPSMDVLRAQFLGLLQSVPQKFLGVLEAPGRELVGVLAARQRELEEAS